MKVAIVSFGHVDVILPLAKYLSKNINVDVYIVFSQSQKFESIVNFENIKVSNGFVAKDKIKTVLGDEIVSYVKKHFDLSVFVYKSLKIYDLKNVFLSYKFAQELLSKDYDLIHLNGNSFFQVYLSIFTPGISKVNTIHDFKSHLGERSRLPIGELLNSYLIRTKRQKIVHAKYNAELINESTKSAKNINVIYYGPLEIYRQFKKTNSDTRKAPPIILFFGRISKYKGIEYLIEAINIVSKKSINVKLIIAGKGDIDSIRSIANRNPNIKIINRYIPTYELVELILNSSIIVCPYIDASQSGVVQTAYAFNKPVIATNVGGLAEVVKSNFTGTIIPPYCSAALASAIMDLIPNKKKIHELSENIRTKLCHKLSWDYIAQETIKVYKKAIKKTINENPNRN